jgi:hypothetical protein
MSTYHVVPTGQHPPFKCYHMDMPYSVCTHNVRCSSSCFFKPAHMHMRIKSRLPSLQLHQDSAAHCGFLSSHRQAIMAPEPFDTKPSHAGFTLQGSKYELWRDQKVNLGWCPPPLQCRWTHQWRTHRRKSWAKCQLRT